MNNNNNSRYPSRKSIKSTAIFFRDRQKISLFHSIEKLTVASYSADEDHYWLRFHIMVKITHITRKSIERSCHRSLTSAVVTDNEDKFAGELVDIKEN